MMRNFVRFLIHTFLKLTIEVEFHNQQAVPTTGSFVMATNHLGMIDIILPYYVLHRWDLFFLVADKWEKIAWVRWLGKHLNFLYIDRENPSLPAMRAVISRMKAGQVLVIAPEGTRSKSEVLLEGKPGVIYLASKLGYPILPGALVGTSDRNVWSNMRRLRKTHVILRAGQPFLLPSLPVKGRDEALQHYTDDLMCKIAVLLPEEYRGAYAEHPHLKELLGE